MTLNEMISHCEQVAEEYDLAAGMYKLLAENSHNLSDKLTMENKASQCAERAETHRQLAEWLTDYEKLRISVPVVNFNNMKEALELNKTLEAGLNAWKEDPFRIISEVCNAMTDCRHCHWHKKCPLPRNCGDWGRTRQLSDTEYAKYSKKFSELLKGREVKPDELRLVEYCWYDGSEAPDYFDESTYHDDFYDEV